MVKYKVEWSIEVRFDLLDILEYYYQMLIIAENSIQRLIKA